MLKVCGVYKIENTITGDFYIGSSKDVKKRWVGHKALSTWKQQPNSPMYKDMQKYGVENFKLTILCEVEPEQLTIMEQKMIEELHPTYNNHYAKGWNVERRRECNRRYRRSDKYKEYQREYRKTYNKGKELIKKYYQSDKGKESQKKYLSQLCSYNGEILTLITLTMRFQRAGVEHPTLEAKKYLIKN